MVELDTKSIILPLEPSTLSIKQLISCVGLISTKLRRILSKPKECLPIALPGNYFNPYAASILFACGPSTRFGREQHLIMNSVVIFEGFL